MLTIGFTFCEKLNFLDRSFVSIQFQIPYQQFFFTSLSWASIISLFALSCAFFISALSDQSIYYSKQNFLMAIELSFQPPILYQYFLVERSYSGNAIFDGSLLGKVWDIFIQVGVFYGISLFYLKKFDFQIHGPFLD